MSTAFTFTTNPGIAPSSVTITLTASDVFVNTTNNPVLVRYVSERASHVNTSGPATDSSPFVPANYVEVISVDPGQKISAIRSSFESDGPVWVATVAKV